MYSKGMACLSYLRTSPNQLMLFFHADCFCYIQTVTNVLGSDIHAKRVGKIHLVQFDSEGVFGLIPTQRELINWFLSGK